jgi:hypothetical protein
MNPADHNHWYNLVEMVKHPGLRELLLLATLLLILAGPEFLTKIKALVEKWSAPSKRGAASKAPRRGRGRKPSGKRRK